MSDFLNKSSVLVLNSLYQAIGTITIKKALIALNSSSNQNDIVAKAINVVYAQNEDGTLNTKELNYWEPLNFEDWMALEPRPDIDSVVHTTKLKLRSPSVIVTSYSKMPMRKFRMTKSLLYDMQQGKCGYTGEKISAKKGNIEHKLPKSHGGKDTFENCMFVDTKINSKRGNKPLADLGLVPLFHHKTPQAMPAHYTIKQAMHPDWFWFIDTR